MAAHKLIASLLLLLPAGCATSFTGDPHIENGRAGCEAKCSGQGMALAGMVFMGEYTSGCVCAVPGQAASSARQQLLGTAASTAGGAAGVVMQMRRQQEQQQYRAGRF